MGLHKTYLSEPARALEAQVAAIHSLGLLPVYRTRRVATMPSSATFQAYPIPRALPTHFSAIRSPRTTRLARITLSSGSMRLRSTPVALAMPSSEDRRDFRTRQATRTRSLASRRMLAPPVSQTPLPSAPILG